MKITEEIFLEETLGFKIMARNFDMLDNLLRGWNDMYVFDSKEGSEIVERIRSITPLHLAVTYLDGSKACCNVVDILMFYAFKFRVLDTNNLGHTMFGPS